MAPRSFAQLLIVLPSVYTGGQYSAKRGSKEWSHKQEGNPIIDTFWLACYNEIPLASESLIMGQRLVMTYEITTSTSEAIPTISGLENPSHASLRSIFARWNMNSMIMAPNWALIPLDFSSTGKKLTMSDVPEHQAPLVNALMHAANESNFSLWLLQFQITFTAEVDSEAEPVQESPGLEPNRYMRFRESRLQGSKKGRLLEISSMAIEIQEAVEMKSDKADPRFKSARELLTVDDFFPVDYFNRTEADEYFVEQGSRPVSSQRINKTGLLFNIFPTQAVKNVTQREYTVSDTSFQSHEPTGFSRVGLFVCPPSKLNELNNKIMDMKDQRDRLSTLAEWGPSDFEYARKILASLEDDSEDAKQLALTFLKSKSWDLICELIHMKRTQILSSIDYMGPEYWTNVVGTFSWSQVRKTCVLVSSFQIGLTQIWNIVSRYCWMSDPILRRSRCTSFSR
jgi:hypothetical protein